MASQDRIEQVFANLDRWRHLPNYQLERRTDIFFSIYLKELVEDFERQKGRNVELLDIIIPELPIKVDGSSRSFKADYVLFSKDRKLAYFIELKTDCESRRPEWDEFVRKAAADGLEKILTNLKEIAGKTVSYGKYYHLLHWLAKAEVIALPDGLKGFIYPKIRPGLRAALGKIKILAGDMQIRVIYIQPTARLDQKNCECCIDFDFVIKHLAQYDDEFSRMFAKHLAGWCSAAGETGPEM